jgi:CBS-domain-containing membrane protein
MTRDVVSFGQLATLGEIADLMEARRIKRVPVLHDGKLVGIVSRADLLRVLASGGANLPDDDRDGSIRSRLLADLRKQRWAHCSESDIVVSDGIVHFCDIVGSEEERKALCVAAENIPGVRGVEDHTISGPLRPGPLFPAI